ncbi:retrovirus-related pol polyprotein from transposon TNT 1-94 [Tanacetum coccineum]
MLAPKCPTFNGRPTFANPMYLKKAQYEKQCLYEIPHDQSDPANRLVPDREETLTLERESREKLNKDLVKPYDYTKLNSLYEILKPPTQEYQIQLAHANEIRKKMWRKSFVKTKPNIFKNINFLPVSKSISKSRQAYNVMTNNINHLRELVDQAWVKHSRDYFRAPTAKDIEILIKTCLMPLALKTRNDSFAFVHELNKEMHVDLKYVESLENEIDELESNKAEFSNMYDILLQECVSNDVMCSYLHWLSDLDAHTELQCLYIHKVKECDCLAQKLSKQTEFVSKEVYTELLRSFAKLEKHSISLELTLQQCQEQMKHDTDCKEKASNVFLKEREQYLEIQDLKAQLQDKNIVISKLKKLIKKCKGKSVETKFDKLFVVRQPNAQSFSKPSVLGKPAPFSDSLVMKNFSTKKSVPKTNESEGLSKNKIHLIANITSSDGDIGPMAQLLEAPTAGYEDAIVVPEITADNFELKHGLLNLVQNKQFFGHDKEDPHAHIRYFNKITSTMKFSEPSRIWLKALLLDKKNQSPAPTPVKAVVGSCDIAGIASAVILNKLPKKLGDPGRFLIPCEFSGINTCNALADLGASINLMPYSVWKNLSLPELTPTCNDVVLADRINLLKQSYR